MDKKNKLKVSLLLGIMCLLLTLGISIQINTVNNSSTTVGRTLAENELRDSVLRWKQKYENAFKDLENKEKELDELREQVANKDESYGGLTDKLKNYNLMLGNTELIGKGVIITLKDGDSSLLKGFANDYIVHNGDLLEIVNALKNADADAISINDQRIVGGTSINCVGNVIKINDEKIAAPFVIKAIGRPIQLYSSLTMPGGYLEILKNAGVQVDIQEIEKESIIIPKYNGVYKFEHATIYE